MLATKLTPLSVVTLVIYCPLLVWSNEGSRQREMICFGYYGIWLGLGKDLAHHFQSTSVAF